MENNEKEHIVVYREFNDGDPYPAEIIKIFKGKKETAMKMAKNFLRKRFISYFEKTPEEYAAEGGEVLGDDFICARTPKGLQYFIAEDNFEVIDADEKSNSGSPASKDMSRAIAEAIAEKTAKDFGFDLSDKDMRSYVTDTVHDFIREEADALYDTDRYAYLIEASVDNFRVEHDPEYRRLINLAAAASRSGNEYKIVSGSKHRYDLLVDRHFVAADKDAAAIDDLIRGVYFGRTGKTLDAD